ncbi:hypothetical protein AJ80_09567, partial [Polytolypa hystricis UAMH7299]
MDNPRQQKQSARAPEKIVFKNNTAKAQLRKETKQTLDNMDDDFAVEDPHQDPTHLSEAHRDLIAGPSSPSGLANRDDAIPYRFLAAVPVRSLGPVSDSL